MGISVGSVSVDIVPDATRFRPEMNAKLKDLTASVRLTLNDKAFDGELAAATRDREVNVKVDDNGSIQRMQGRSHALLTTLALLAPAAAPLTAVAIGGATALAGLGGAGILAIKGISAEMKAGTPLGNQYTAMVGGLKTDLADLERVAARGVLSGVRGAISAVSQSMPELRREVGLLSASLGSDLEPITRGILGLFQDLFPTTQSIASGIHSLAIEFDTWANGPGGKAFAAYLAKELPIVASTLVSIGTAGAHVVQALLPLGGPILKGITGISTVIAHIPVHIIEELFLAFAGYKAITLTAAAIDAVTLATTRLGIAQGTGGVGGVGGKVGAGLGVAGLGVGGLIGAVGAGLNPDELKSPYQRAQANFQAEHPTAGPKGFTDFVKSAATDPKAAAQLKEYASQSYKAKAAQDALGGSVGTTTTRIAAEAAATTAWATALDDAFTKASGVKSAQIGVSQAIADATTSLKENGRTLDLHTQKGRNNATALLAVATAEHNKIDADVAGSASQRTINKDFTDGRDKLIHIAEKFGLSKTAAKKYADTLLGIKPLVKTTIVVNTASAQAKLDALKAGFSAIQFYANQKDNGPTAPGTGGAGPHGGPAGARGGYMWGGAFHRSGGGPVWGAGTATSDSVRAYLSNGEFVVKAATVKSVGVPFLNQLNATGQTATTAGPSGPGVQMNVYPRAGQSEYEIATIAARQLMFALTR